MFNQYFWQGTDIIFAGNFLPCLLLCLSAKKNMPANIRLLFNLIKLTTFSLLSSSLRSSSFTIVAATAATPAAPTAAPITGKAPDMEGGFCTLTGVMDPLDEGGRAPIGVVLMPGAF